MTTARILFIEDSGEEVFLAQCYLTRAGIRSEARLVHDQHSEQQVLTSWRPDLIVADFKLAKFDGWTAYVTARTFAPEIPFIFRSRDISRKRVRQARERGALACLHKEETQRFVAIVRGVISYGRQPAPAPAPFVIAPPRDRQSLRVRESE